MPTTHLELLPALEQVPQRLGGSALGRPEPAERGQQLGVVLVDAESAQLARVLRARGERRWLVPVRIPGAAGRAMAEGALLPGPEARLGTLTFDAWLAETARPLR